MFLRFDELQQTAAERPPDGYFRHVHHTDTHTPPKVAGVYRSVRYGNHFDEKRINRRSGPRPGFALQCRLNPANCQYTAAWTRCIPLRHGRLCQSLRRARCSLSGLGNDRMAHPPEPKRAVPRPMCGGNHRRRPQAGISACQGAQMQERLQAGENRNIATQT